ncbi:MAG: protein phosphatase 2C domain-containing protein [Anaerolinea sp.]|nr:protein phosphatase 2C domain-containing protein [Anaerolinea sp.]
MTLPTDLPCSHCGAPNRPEARFCARCGQALHELLAEPFAEPTPTALPDTAPLSLAELLGEDAPSWQPAPGELLHGRYRILTIQEQTETYSQYAAHDLGQCPLCLVPFAEWPPDSFCPTCGAALVEPLTRALRQYLADAVPDMPTDATFQHEGFLFAVMAAQVEAEPPLLPAPRQVRLRVGFQTDVGQERDLDEDSLLLLHLTGVYEGAAQLTLGFFAVADGIGGHDGGEVASRLALQRLGQVILDRFFKRAMSQERGLSLERLTEALQKGIVSANKAVFEQRQARQNDMGTTVTAVLIYNDQAIIANVGDSRTYLWRGGVLQQITRDHSLVASLIAAQQLAPEAIYTHEQKNVIYRSLGDKPDFTADMVDTFPLPLYAGDRLILCCDGVWEMVRDEGIEEVMLSAHTPQQACDELVKRANLAGGEDNISVIVIVVD